MPKVSLNRERGIAKIRRLILPVLNDEPAWRRKEQARLKSAYQFVADRNAQPLWPALLERATQLAQEVESMEDKAAYLERLEKQAQAAWIAKQMEELQEDID